MGFLIAGPVLCCWLFWRMFLSLSLLPVKTADLPWQLATESDQYWGGKSEIQIEDAESKLAFTMHIDRDIRIPSASVSLIFTDRKGVPVFADLSRYNKIAFKVKCSPENVLGLAVFVPDGVASDPANVDVYRFPQAHFSCAEEWTNVAIDLHYMDTPLWWFDQHKINISEHEYSLEKVAKIAFSSTFQSPRDVASNVLIEDLVFIGREWKYLYLAVVALLFSLGCGAYWYFRTHKSVLIQRALEKLQGDRPVIAYQALPLEPFRQRANGSVLHFMATEYSDPDLSLETVAKKMGMGRNKINEVLRAESGYTFTTFLNRIRLTEAARLLADNDSVNVAEIAYSVGYRHVSYFNKLFKSQYGCTPQQFRKAAKNTPESA